jgi:hypothetical protein
VAGPGAAAVQWRSSGSSGGGGVYTSGREMREREGGGGGKNVRGTISAYVRRAIPSDGYMLRTSI